MSKSPKKTSTPFKKTAQYNKFAVYTHQENGLTLLHFQRPNTGVITSNITYFVGARDEGVGETGAAHMLEHMLFKPTKQELIDGLDSGAMRFEREVGAVLNANTWKDRTTYYFCFPKNHIDRVLQIEADRMRNVVLTDESLFPERSNVLSEFDMYNGRPDFALSVGVACTAFHNHPYGHETIGFREDIERYTASMLDRFYTTYYQPNNAVLMLIGDITENDALSLSHQHFGHIPRSSHEITRTHAPEPKQEGTRRFTINRPGTENLITYAVKAPSFPSHDWYVWRTLLEIIAGDSVSVVKKALIDSGVASHVHYEIDPFKDINLAQIVITLSPRATHEKVEAQLRKTLASIDATLLKKQLKPTITQMVAHELFATDNSLEIAAELTELASAGALATYDKTVETLQAITVAQLQAALTELRNEQHLTIGFYKSF